MKVTVTDIDIDSSGTAQRFRVTAARHEDYKIAIAAPVTDLPDDIRDALLKWLGGER